MMINTGWIPGYLQTTGRMLYEANKRNGGHGGGGMPPQDPKKNDDDNKTKLIILTIVLAIGFGAVLFYLFA